MNDAQVETNNLNTDIIENESKQESISETERVDHSEEEIPQLFSDEEIVDSQTKEFSQESFSETLLKEENTTESEDEDFEIPAFLRKQKN